MDRFTSVFTLPLFLIGILLASHACYGTEKEAKTLLLFEANIYRTLGDMSDYIFKEKDQKTLQSLKQTIATGDKQLQVFAQRWPEIENKWRDVIHLMHSDLIDDKNSDNVKFPRRYEVAQQALTDEVKKAREQIALSEISASERPVLMALIHLEQIVGGYTFYNINVFGGFSVPDTGIEDYVALFKQEIDNLNKVNQKLAGKLQRKWRFIEKTVLNYNQNSAVFIVRRTAESLRDITTSGLLSEQLAAE